MLPDRFADRLVANLQSFCTFRKGGCQWVGKRGDMCGHLARECQMVIVACPHNCGTELPRGELWKHVETCAQAAQTDCPWGCGMCLGAAQMEVTPAPPPAARPNSARPSAARARPRGRGSPSVRPACNALSGHPPSSARRCTSSSA